VVYARAGESFAPVFVEGRAVPPALTAGSPLAATLAERRRPLALSADGRRPDPATLGPFDRAALEMLAVEVIVPVRREALVAFLCLGPKRSGDVYTSSDLSHLAAVAEAVSSELRRFDQEQLIREARAMQEALRRYVPGAVAEELASGAALEPAEREVSVLFVDIRGYTSFSEPRRAGEIFSTVNRYTETVSAIVRKHGGAVVEFNGDGMMAVFGAPRELPAKERAAVAAGREIVGAVETLPVEDAKGGAEKLSVGVGIATGSAFVGNIRAADRMIWSAIGNTTNLAARLQALTRELGAALVIDAATWRALPEPGGFRRHPALSIRGRREPEDVYALPQAASPSDAQR
jgi:class 3 adenylate cyclase